METTHIRKEYSYSPLRSDSTEIRLVTILPGHYDEPLRLEISRVPFQPLVRIAEEDEERLPEYLLFPKAFNRDVPSGWASSLTASGRWIFTQVKEVDDIFTIRTSWDFPVPRLAEAFKEALEPTTATTTGPCSPSFDALSYAWGGTHKPVPVLARDHNTDSSQFDSYIFVQPSLISALRRLRYPDTERRMWIDAICINQKDKKEKAVQIPYMWAIYTRATRTIVWLGPEFDDSATAIQRLHYIGNNSVLMPDGARWPQPGDDWDLDVFQDPYSMLNDADIVAISNLLHREYFQRLWIVSELAMANQKAVIHCGDATISLEDFRCALKCLSASPTRPPFELLGRLLDIKALTSQSSYAAFSTILELYRHYECSNALDKVYGLLSLASKAFAEWVEVNCNLSCEDLFQSVFLAVIKFFERLDLLQACRLDLAFPGRPSWIPNLSVPYQYWRPLEYCSGCSEPEYEIISDQSIRVSGIRCCTVGSICATFTGESDLLSGLSACWSSISDRKTLYPTSESIEDAFTRTICLDRTAKRYPGASDVETKFYSKDVDRLIEIIKWGVKNPHLPATSHADYDVLVQLTGLLAGKDFFETQCGHFGLGPGITQEGDVVCAFLGSTNLTILRPQLGDSYKVVGHGFVHGFHDATPFLGPLPTDWRVVVLDDNDFGNKIRFRNLAVAGSDVTLEICSADTVFDPRLGELPPGWEWCEVRRTKNDPDLFEEFYHESDKYIHSDPRMSAEALRARGVVLEAFDLI